MEADRAIESIVQLLLGLAPRPRRRSGGTEDTLEAEEEEDSRSHAPSGSATKACDVVATSSNKQHEIIETTFRPLCAEQRQTWQSMVRQKRDERTEKTESFPSQPIRSSLVFLRAQSTNTLPRTFELKEEYLMLSMTTKDVDWIVFLENRCGGVLSLELLFGQLM